jgi:hypothetical protein
MIRDMMNNRELIKARQRAAHYGNPGDHVKAVPRYGTPTPKSGFFTGYWNCGSVAWQGQFENGVQVGMWKYTSTDTVSSCNEFYCNL